MENTLENKSKFFAQYWEQKVAVFNDQSRGTVNNTIWNRFSLPAIDCIKYLELIPLSQISDEDAIEVAKILRYNYEKKVSVLSKTTDEITCVYEDDKAIVFYVDFSGHSTYDDYRFIGYPYCDSGFSYDFDSFRISVDYLRSKGYALSWMNLTVEQLIEYKWIVLKK